MGRFKLYQIVFEPTRGKEEFWNIETQTAAAVADTMTTSLIAAVFASGYIPPDIALCFSLSPKLKHSGHNKLILRARLNFVPKS